MKMHEAKTTNAGTPRSRLALVGLWATSLMCIVGLTGCFGMIGKNPNEGRNPGVGGPAHVGNTPNPRRTPPVGGRTTPPKPRTSPDGGSTDAGPDTSPDTRPDTPNTTPPPAPACSVPPPAVQRITREQYKHSIMDVLGLDVKVTTLLPSDVTQDYGFATAGGFSVKYAKAYMEAAEHVLSRLDLEQLTTLLPCKLASGDDACAKTFFLRVGRRLFRRPVTSGEEGRVMGLFRSLKSAFGFAEAVKVSLQFFLQSPHFLYRVERGVTPPGKTTKVLSGYEVATRLAAFLWQSVPDETLLKAAQDGKLSTQAEIEGQARRMLSHLKAKRTIHRFFEQWLDLEHLGDVVKDKDAYPGFTAAIAADMKTETMKFVDHVIWQQGASFKTLLTARYSFINQRLAQHYGIPNVLGQQFRRVDWTRHERIGILTHGSLLTVHANIDQSSPIHRGVFVRKRLLCGEPKVPDGLDVSPPRVDPSLPTRKRFEEHRKNPDCAGCHALFDPIGFGFEHFDGVGRYRSTEGGKPVDARGDMVSSDIDGPFNGPVELAHKLVGSADAQQCFVAHWFRFAVGRRETASDECLLRDVHAHFVKRGLDIKELLVLLVSHPLFRHAQGKVSVPKVGDKASPLTAAKPTSPVTQAPQARLDSRGCSSLGRGPHGGILWIVLSFLLALSPLWRRHFHRAP